MLNFLKLNKTIFSLAMVVEKTNSFGVFVNGTWGGMRGKHYKLYGIQVNVLHFPCH